MRQKGQGIIEFAVIVPMLVALGISLVYVGIMFLDYTQYSNAARDAARDISLKVDSTSERQAIVDAINADGQAHQSSDSFDHNSTVSRYQNPYTKIYKPIWSARFYDKDNKSSGVTASNAVDVEVTIELVLRNSDGSSDGGTLTSWGVSWNIIPTSLKPVTYRMVLE